MIFNENPCSPAIRVSFGASFVCAYNCETHEKHIEEHSIGWNMIEPNGLDEMYVFLQAGRAKGYKGKGLFR